MNVRTPPEGGAHDAHGPEGSSHDDTGPRADGVRRFVMVKLYLRHDRRIKRLARHAGIERAHALGLVVDLWLWAADNRPLGYLTDTSAEDLAISLDTDFDPDSLWRAMVSAGVIWELGDGRAAVADWLDDDLGRPHARHYLVSSFAGHMAQHVKRDRFVESCWACIGEVPVAIPITELITGASIAAGFPHPNKGTSKKRTT